MKLKPSDGYVAMVVVTNDTTSSGIYLPENQKEQKYFEVVESKSKKYKKGEKVIPNGQLMQVNLGDKQYVLVHEDSIIATIA